MDKRPRRQGLKNIILKALAKLAILGRLVDFEAQTILGTVENIYKNVYAEPEAVNLLTNYKVREAILQKYTTDDQVRNYFGDAGSANVKKLRVEHIIQEAIHRIKIQVFGNEKFGLQSFIQLKRTVSAMKIGPGYNIKAGVNDSIRPKISYQDAYGLQEPNKIYGLKLMEKKEKDKSLNSLFRRISNEAEL